ncbi:MAG TPA: alcohol dehydrogenase catalytic domain-containing protein [Solirubrobacterales bacterium]|jgi:threonine dehydrogenase-like Zn-dependent dehydrogenase
MLAARAYEGEAELRLEQIEDPVAGPGEVLIEVAAAGIAPGQFSFWQMGLLPILPHTPGNEVAGTVAAVGAGVTELAAGDRVRLHPNLTCRRCEFCLTDREQLCPACSVIGQAAFGPQARPLYDRYHDGGLAEYVLAPAWAVDPLPDTVSFEAAAKIADVATAVRALKLAALPVGATVVWTAATGTIGPAAVRLAPLFGISRLIAVARSEERLAKVRALAPDLVETVGLDGLDEDWETSGGLTAAIRELAPGGVDAVLDFLPEGQATPQSIAAMKLAGTAVIVGGNTTAPLAASTPLTINCWRIIGNRNGTHEDARQVMAWLASGTLEIDDLVTHRFPLSEVNAAANIARKREEPAWMTLVLPKG